MLDTATSEAKDQIAEHDWSMDPGVGLESPNWFFGISLAAGQVGADPAYSQYLVQSHLNTTSVNQSVQESNKDGFRHRKGDHQHCEQPVQQRQRTPETNYGATQRLLRPDDNRDPDILGGRPDDIVRLRQILPTKTPEEYDQQEGGRAPVLHGPGPIQ